MITPRFKFVDEMNIIIYDKDTGREIGKIESPSATISGAESAIQVCGFSYACDLWGCGVYGFTDKDGNYHAKKDIQLLWAEFGDKDTRCEGQKRTAIDNCSKCYSKPCKCDELRIYQGSEPILEKL